MTTRNSAGAVDSGGSHGPPPPPCTSATPTLGIAVVVTAAADRDRVDRDAVETARVALLAAIEAVGRARTIMTGPAPVEDLAVELGVGFAESDGTWDDGARRALAISPAELLLLSAGDTVVIASLLREAAVRLTTDEAWATVDVFGTTSGMPRSDAWLAPGTLVRTSIALPAMQGRTAAAAAWLVRSSGWRGGRRSSFALAAQGDVSSSADRRAAVVAGGAVIRATLGPGSPLWSGSCPIRVRVAAVSAALRQLRGVAVALVVVATAGIVVGGVPFAGVSTWSLASIVVLGAVVATGASSIDVSVGSVLQALASGPRAAGAHRLRRRRKRQRQRQRIGATALLDRPVTVVLTIALEACLVVRGLISETADGHSAADRRADLLALGLGLAVLVPMLVSLGVIVRSRPRRRSSRVAVSLPVRVDGRAGTVTDIGARGLAVMVDGELAVGSHVTVELGDPGVEICVPAVVARLGTSEGSPGDGSIVGLRVVMTPFTADTDAFQRLWVERTAAAVAAGSRPPVGAIPDRHAVRPVRWATAVTAGVIALAVAPPYPASAAGVPASEPGTRSALPFAVDPETDAPGRAAPSGTIHH